jgi:hypothetical protein
MEILHAVFDPVAATVLGASILGSGIRIKWPDTATRPKGWTLLLDALNFLSINWGGKKANP